MNRSRVVVLDYGFGNVRSAVRALERIGASVELTREKKAALEADGLVVPGVGAFAEVMRGLREVGGPQLIDTRLAGGRPVLGICVGMQVMFSSGSERGEDTLGLGHWPGRVRMLKAPVLPHMGWSTVDPASNSILFKGVEEERFYFVHSCAATKMDPLGAGAMAAPLLTWAEHGESFLAAVENSALSATQFHPEKSGDAGTQLLKNWADTLK